MRVLLAVLVCTAIPAATASALSSSASGTFIAIDDAGQPTEKVLRVSQQGGNWKFEDRQPDGSWLDVSCHGGCEHRDSQADDLITFFGAPPPPDIQPECVQNEQYAFCQFIKASEQREGYVLVVRMGEDWMPVSLLRLPDVPDEYAPAPKLEAASAAGL